MSLQLAAQHLAAKGRGPDKQLVHMSPREVAGLQALAMAHGGSLSINPETGLPEAGFLDNMLPAIIGAGLMFATGGASAAAMPGLFGLGMPATIGLGLGAFETARTGNLQKGLMAGLGAYGGAGMLGSVMGAGTGALSASAAPAQTAIPTPAMPVVPEAAGTISGQSMFSPPLGTEFPAQFAPPNAPAIQTFVQPSDATESVRLVEGLGMGDPGYTNNFAGSDIDVFRQSLKPSAVTTASPATITPAPMMDPNIVSEATQERLLADKLAAATPADTAKAGLRAIADKPSLLFNKGNLKYGLAAAAPALLAQPKRAAAPELDREQYRYAYTPGKVANPEERYMGALTGERTYFEPRFTRLAEGGVTEGGGMGGRISRLGGQSEEDSQDQNKYTYDPVKQQYTKIVPPVVPLAAIEAALPFVDTGGYGGGDMGGGPAGPTSGGAYSGVTSASFDAAGMGEGSLASGGGPSGATADAAGGTNAGGGDYGPSGFGDYANGGSISHLGDYSDGGRLLRGPGDGVSDSIPAMIGRKQPARLADGEFVIPARIVSELGNGSTNAGARKLYAMMDRIQKARGKTVGKGKVAKNSKAEKYLPA